MSKTLDGKTRRQAFRRLVELQDRGHSVSVSHEQVASDFQISIGLSRMIEMEGLRNEWPPLGGAPGCAREVCEVKSR